MVWDLHKGTEAVIRARQIGDDQMIVNLADQIHQTDPDGAMEWAGDIGDEEQRATTVKKIEKANGGSIVIPDE